MKVKWVKRLTKEGKKIKFLTFLTGEGQVILYTAYSMNEICYSQGTAVVTI